METRRLILEPRWLIMEPSRLTIEPWNREGSVGQWL
jgi:hypothetical protein